MLGSTWNMVFDLNKWYPINCCTIFYIDTQSIVARYFFCPRIMSGEAKRADSNSPKLFRDLSKGEWNIINVNLNKKQIIKYVVQWYITIYVFVDSKLGLIGFLRITVDHTQKMFVIKGQIFLWMHMVRPQPHIMAWDQTSVHIHRRVKQWSYFAQKHTFLPREVYPTIECFSKLM